MYMCYSLTVYLKYPIEHQSVDDGVIIFINEPDDCAKNHIQKTVKGKDAMLLFNILNKPEETKQLVHLYELGGKASSDVSLRVVPPDKDHKNYEIVVYQGDKVTPVKKFSGNTATTLYNILLGDCDLDTLKMLWNGTNLMESEEASKSTSEFDPVTKPSHYVEGREYEPRKVIEDWDLNYYLGNALKYISRAGRKKDPVEDLKKARQYLDFEIERLEREDG